MAPDRKRAYGLVQQIGRYEFWAFDVEQRKLVLVALRQRLGRRWPVRVAAAAARE